LNALIGSRLISCKLLILFNETIAGIWFSGG
jgi:hypothetical protein